MFSSQFDCAESPRAVHFFFDLCLLQFLTVSLERLHRQILTVLSRGKSKVTQITLFYGFVRFSTSPMLYS